MSNPIEPMAMSFDGVVPFWRFAAMVIDLVLLLLLLGPADGFASNLVVTTFGCMTELSIEEFRLL